MSKRNRHKKKKLKALKKINNPTPAVEATAEDIKITEETGKISDVRAEKSSPAVEEPDSIIDAPTRKLIGKDVQMIIFTLLGLAIVLTAVKILQLKTGYIDNFGNWLYKITNIQTM